LLESVNNTSLLWFVCFLSVILLKNYFKFSKYVGMKMNQIFFLPFSWNWKWSMSVQRWV